MASLWERILLANVRIRPQVPVSPLERSSKLSDALGCDVLLKFEHLQPTGSFKIRGATNKILSLDEGARRAGVITASTGNHGQAVALAGALAGVPVTVYVAATATRSKMDAIRALGAELVIIDGTSIEAEMRARKDALERGVAYISPYNDLDVVAGQGTLGMELIDQAPDLDAVFIAVGGGGLIGGTGAALQRLRPETRVIGVWPENSACMLGAIEAGEIVDIAERPTISDGTAGAIEPGSVTFPLCQDLITETATVSEPEITDAMRRVAESDRWIVEGAAGVALAGLIKTAGSYRGAKVAVVLCGRNIALDSFLCAIER